MTYRRLLILLCLLTLGPSGHVGKDTIRTPTSAINPPTTPSRRIHAGRSKRRRRLRRCAIARTPAGGRRRILSDKALSIVGLVIAVIIIVKGIGEGRVDLVVLPPGRGGARVEGRRRRAGDDGLREVIVGGGKGGVDVVAVVVIVVVSVYLDTVSIRPCILLEVTDRRTRSYRPAMVGDGCEVQVGIAVTQIAVSTGGCTFG